MVEIGPDEIRGMSPEDIEEYRKTKTKAVQNWYYEFGQGAPRARADKLLLDMILARQIHWPANTPGVDMPRVPTASNSFLWHEDTLQSHVLQAGSSAKGDKFRLIKLGPHLHNDAVVALGMATDMCLRLELAGRGMSEIRAKAMYDRGESTADEYIRILAKN